MPYTDISAQLRGFQAPRLVRETFTSRTELGDYLNRLMPGRTGALPRVDWGRREAILISSGPRSSTGYSLSVVSVREQGDRLKVTVREHTPSLGQRVTARVTYPFRLITVPRTSKRLLLHFEGRP